MDSESVSFWVGVAVVSVTVFFVSMIVIPVHNKMDRLFETRVCNELLVRADTITMLDVVPECAVYIEGIA